jgi:hypothetical protein
LVGVIGVTIGIFIHRPVAAVALSVALFSSLLPVFDVLATRFPLLVNLQSYTPGGAATTVLESNAGIATSSGLLSLRHGRPAIVGLAVLFAWAVALISAGLVRRSRSEDPNHTAFTRVIKVLLLTTSVVVLLAAVLPYMARTAFPWYLKPAWLHDVARGSSSIDAVDEFVASLRRGESPSPYVDPGDALWQPIRNGSVDVVDERSLTRPDVVAVGVTDPDDVGRRYTYEFELVRVANGWEVTRVHSAID